MADTCEVWHKKNRRIFARVKTQRQNRLKGSSSTFWAIVIRTASFRYVQHKASAAEDEEATRRLNWQEANGYLLHYEEFVFEQANLALETYEQRLHSSLKHSRDEMMKVIENEGWA